MKRLLLLSLVGFAALVMAAAGHRETPAPSPAVALTTDRAGPLVAAPSDAYGELAYGPAFVREPIPEPSDAFDARSWTPPAPPKTEGPPPKPVAPPLPFAFSGVMEDGQRTLFLRRGDSLVVAREGELLDGTYRVEAIGAEQATFTYLPLTERQMLLYPK